MPKHSLIKLFCQIKTCQFTQKDFTLIFIDKHLAMGVKLWNREFLLLNLLILVRELSPGFERVARFVGLTVDDLFSCYQI